MSDMSFTWRGESSDMHGVVVRSLPPIHTPQKRDEAEPIPGRHGSLHKQDGAYEEQLMMIECYLPYEQDVHVSPIETIKAWLTGYGDLTLSDRPGRLYKAHIIDAIAFSQWVIGFEDRIFAVSFWADPLAYETVSEAIPLMGPTSFDNPSAIPAMPLITIQGSGQVRLFVGEVTVTLDNLAGVVTIDSDAKWAYKGSTDNQIGITLDDEDWPVLGPGETQISWQGSVQHITVTPRWRYL